MLVFPKEKHQNSQKMGEIHELFVLALSLVWFAGATPDSRTQAPPIVAIVGEVFLVIRFLC